MIRVKDLFDPVEADDGLRIWAEPLGLTRDLQEWCDVDYVLPQLGPPLRAWRELQANPEAYDHFAAAYHAHLAEGPHRPTLDRLASLSATRNLTLLHAGDDPYRNSAMVLFEFLSSHRQRADQ